MPKLILSGVASVFVPKMVFLLHLLSSHGVTLSGPSTHEINVTQ